MKTRFITAFACVVLAAAPTRASNGQIGFEDTRFRACGWPVPCQGTLRLYVYGLLFQASGGGITGAEYKVQIGGSNAADVGYFFTETFDPTATVLGAAFNPGDPLSRGVNVSWPTCQAGTDGRVIIETVDVFNAGCSTVPMDLLVVKHDTPSNQFFQCPMFVLCDAPVYTEVCVGSNLTTCRNPEPPFPNNATCSTSGSGQLNPDCPYCCIAVENSSWSGVKSLYRE